MSGPAAIDQIQAPLDERGENILRLIARSFRIDHGQLFLTLFTLLRRDQAQHGKTYFAYS